MQSKVRSALKVVRVVVIATAAILFVVKVVKPLMKHVGGSDE